MKFYLLYLVGLSRPETGEDLIWAHNDDNEHFSSSFLCFRCSCCCHLITNPFHETLAVSTPYFTAEHVLNMYEIIFWNKMFRHTWQNVGNKEKNHHVFYSSKNGFTTIQLCKWSLTRLPLLDRSRMKEEKITSAYIYTL